MGGIVVPKVAELMPERAARPASLAAVVAPERRLGSAGTRRGADHIPTARNPMLSDPDGLVATLDRARAREQTKHAAHMRGAVRARARVSVARRPVRWMRP